jgi:DNA polymerase III subunit epsilon
MQLCFIDTETTGLHPSAGDRICEIALIKTDSNLEIIEKYESLINPSREISPEAYRVNKIEQSQLISSPEFSELSGIILRFVESCNLVGHNVAFDYDFLVNEFNLCRIAYKAPYTLDTKEIAQTLTKSSSYGLSTLIKLFNVKIKNRHRAMGDCQGTLDVLKGLFDKYRLKTGKTLDMMLDKFARKINSDIPALPPQLQNALENRLDLQIEYCNRENYQTNRIIQPLRVFSSRGKTYIEAYCHLKNSNRTFLLDRIKIVSDS